jgi:hypothetical protein
VFLGALPLFFLVKPPVQEAHHACRSFEKNAEKFHVNLCSIINRKNGKLLDVEFMFEFNLGIFVRYRYVGHVARP